MKIGCLNWVHNFSGCFFLNKIEIICVPNLVHFICMVGGCRYVSGALTILQIVSSHRFQFYTITSQFPLENEMKAENQFCRNEKEHQTAFSSIAITATNQIESDRIESKQIQRSNHVVFVCFLHANLSIQPNRFLDYFSSFFSFDFSNLDSYIFLCCCFLSFSNHTK